MRATHPFAPRVAVVFDFDRTLATDSIDALCATWGITREEWEARFCEPLGEGWDQILKRAHALIACGRKLGAPLSREHFAHAARQIALYPGVAQLKDRLTAAAREIDPGLEVELTVLSAGFEEIIRRTDVSRVFDRIWAGAFHFDDDGAALALKRMIGHSEKALYLESYSKGLDLDAASEPETDRPDFDPDMIHVPVDQMIYVGDGSSDLQAFAFMAAHGGLALAVKKDGGDQFAMQTRDQRVENLAPPDFQPGGEMLRSLCHAVRSAASRAALRRLGTGE